MIGTRSRLDAVVAIVVSACLIGVALWTAYELRRQTANLLASATEDRARQLEHAIARVASDFDEVAVDLDFAAHLVERAPDDTVTRDSLQALLAAMRPYRIGALYAPDCTRRLSVSDPRWDATAAPELLAELDTWSVETCRRADAVVRASLPLPPDGWFRVFSRSLPGGGAMGFVVDTSATLARLTPVSNDPTADLLVLGPHGHPVRISAPRLAAALSDERSPALAEVTARMLAGDRGRHVIPADEAARIGYPEADAVMVFAPIRGDDGAPPWSAATVFSTAALGRHERAVFVRVGASAIVAAGLLLLAGAYVLRVQRTEAATSERLRSADQVAHLRERAERILDHVPAGVVALGEGGVTSANEVARRWGRPDAQTLRELLPSASDASLARLEELTRSAIYTGRVHGFVAEQLSLFGEGGTYSVHAVPIVPASPEVRALLVVADLTEVQRLQEQLLRVEKLATVGVLAAGIAHEVGTPLGVIRGRAELVGRKLGSEHPQARSVVVIVEQIDRIARTIRALLDFARPRPLAAGEVSVAVPFERVGDLVRYEVQKRQVTFDAKIDPGLPLVRGDPDQIQQVLVNLVMNALDATPSGRRIEMSAAFALDTTGPHVSLRVKDEGCGIPAEHLHQIFDPFFTTKKRGDGTGLGLTIVNQIARAHGGLVRVDSTPGRGTTVEVLLPVAGAAK